MHTHLHLTPAQHSTLERVPETCKVIGTDGEGPVLMYPGGRVSRVNEHGRLVVATDKLVDAMRCREIDILLPKRH